MEMILGWFEDWGDAATLPSADARLLKYISAPPHSDAPLLKYIRSTPLGRPTNSPRGEPVRVGWSWLLGNIIWS